MWDTLYVQYNLISKRSRDKTQLSTSNLKASLIHVAMHATTRKFHEICISFSLPSRHRYPSVYGVTPTSKHVFQNSWSFLNSGIITNNSKYIDSRIEKIKHREEMELEEGLLTDRDRFFNGELQKEKNVYVPFCNWILCRMKPSN